MASTLPLEKLLIEEHLPAMKLLCDDLFSRAGVIPSPASRDAWIRTRLG